MLSMHSEITEWDIENIQVLRPGTVYKLTGHAGETLVVKVESSYNLQPESFKMTKLAMKAVDPRAGNAKLLTDNEKNEIKKFVEFMKRVTQDFSANMVSQYDAGPAAQDLWRIFKDPLTPVWYKMPFESLSDADKLLALRLGDKGGAKDKSLMYKFAQGLKEPGGLEQLGKIIAADMFNGNGDRFNPLEGSKNHYGGKDLRFRVIKNIGNVFVIGKNTDMRFAVSGHDFLDPNSPFRNFNLTVAEIQQYYTREDGSGEEWLGDYLCDPARRKKFAKDVAHDLEKIVSPNRKALSPFRKLGREGHAAKRVEKGMLQGMRAIVDAVDRRFGKAGKGQMPPGLQDRRNRYDQAARAAGY